MNAPWFVRQPVLFQRELAELSRDYPELKLDESALRDGTLILDGKLSVALGPKTEDVTISLQYPAGFPYLRPDVVPLEESTQGSIAPRVPRFFSARHQMANGSICLFERDPADDPHAYITGGLAMRRARIWLPYALRGTLPDALDSVESELEGHYQRMGDVLLGPAMFDDLGNGGELVVVPFPAPGRSEKYPLFIVTHVLARDTWRDDRRTVQRLGLDLGSAFWKEKPPAISGLLRIRWYGLGREPKPIRSSSQLAELLFPDDAAPLARLKREAASTIASQHAFDVALRIPDRREGSHAWLFLRFQLRDESLATVKLPDLPHAGQLLDLSGSRTLDDTRPLILKSQDLRRASLVIRNTGRVPTSASTLSFSLAGAGALGSACADLIAKAGVERIRIVDPAFLDAHNAVRHTGSVTAAGAPKVLVVGGSALGHNPHCDVSYQCRSVLELEGADAVWSTTMLSTIADDAMELALNRLAISRGTTVYYLRALRSGSAGRLVRVRPGLDACLECLGHYHAEGDPLAARIPPQPDEVITRECGQPVLAASAADLAVVAGLSVKQLLADATEEAETNQWVWTTEGIPDAPGLEQPFSRRQVTLRPHLKCAVCAVNAPRRAIITPTLRAELIALARRHAPNETGGILVGRLIRDTLHILAVSEAGPNAISEPERFERDGPYGQAFLDRMASEMPGVDYVGEWHSHPGSRATPSPRDTQSFAEIAADSNYFTTDPLLVIVAPQSNGDVEWSSTLFPLSALARALPLENGEPVQTLSTDELIAEPSASTS